MKKSLLTIIITLFISSFLFSQEYYLVEIGASYANQAYYTIETDESVKIGNNTWDLAFANTSSFEVGVHVNESVDLSFTGPSPKTLLFQAPTNDFNAVIAEEEIGDSLYNNEQSWAVGALNMLRDTTNPSDFGWGMYNPNNHAIQGNRVFVIQLRDNSYRKFIIESLIGGIYTLKHSNLDGSDEKVALINKADYSNSHLILFSFKDNAVIDNNPTTWDLSFQRYSDLDPNNVDVFVEYTVTGILTAPGVLTIQVDDADPDNIKFEDHKDKFENSLDVIGQDWKYFSFETGWEIIENRVFFVKTADNHLWQMVLYDFSGSSAGGYAFGFWDLGFVSKVENMNSNFNNCTIVPNPIKSGEEFSIVVESKNYQKTSIKLMNINGQVIYSTDKTFNEGLNYFKMPSEYTTPGNYILTIDNGSDKIVRKVSIK